MQSIFRMRLTTHNLGVGKGKTLDFRAASLYVLMAIKIYF